MAALSIGAAAQADVKFSGDTSINYTNVKNGSGTKDNNSESWTMWNNLMVDGNKGEKLSYHLNLRHVSVFGSNLGVTPSGKDGSSASATANARNQQNDMVYVQEAVAYARVGENGTFSFGRSGLELNQGQLVSKRSFDDNQVAFDGVRYVHDADWGRLGLSYSIAGRGDTTVTNFAGAGTAQSSRDRIKFRGLSYTMKNTPEAISNLEFHYVSASADGAFGLANGTNKNSTRTWVGVNVAGEMGKFDYQVDVENFSGDKNDGVAGTAKAAATMMDVELGMRFSAKDSRAYLVYHNDGTGTDGVYDGLYYDTHKNAGLMDVMSWGNLSQIGLGYTMKPSADCDFGVAYHKFDRVKTDKAIGSFGTGNTEKDAGSEIDVWFGHNYSSGMYVKAELGTFSPGAYLKDAGNKESITRLYLETGFAF